MPSMIRIAGFENTKLPPKTPFQKLRFEEAIFFKKN
jgi:hypothetical protein